MKIFDFLLEPTMVILPKLPEIIFNLLVGYVLIKLVMWMVKHFFEATRLPKLKGIVLSLLNAALWVVLAIYIANNLGFTQLAIAISSSVLVLVFFLNTGLAPLITDAVSGIFLCTDPDFKVGSRVRIGKGDEVVEGWIKEIDMRKVRIRDDENNIHVISNSTMDKDGWMVIEKPESAAKKTAAAARNAIKRKISKKKSEIGDRG